MRNKAIDMMRALTMVLMVTVNEFWSVEGIPHWMHHAKITEDMMGLSDVVFPLFLFAMGMSIPYAIENKINQGASGRDIVAHILSRSIALLTMGAFICNSEHGIGETSGYTYLTYTILMVLGFFLIWNRYPIDLNKWVMRGLKITGIAILLFLIVSSRSTEGAQFSAYWWGILGLIGWTYLVCAMIYFLFRNSRKMLLITTCAFLTINILVTRTNPAHGEISLLHVHFLHDVLGILHIDNGAHCALGMGGILLSVFTRDFVGNMDKRRGIILLCCSVMLMVAFAVTHHYFIISKLVGTTPWVLAVMALAVVMYVFFSVLSEKGWDGWFRWIAPAGTSTLTCYMMPYVFHVAMQMTSFQWWECTRVYPIGLLRCLCFAMLCVGLTWVLGKLKIGLKI